MIPVASALPANVAKIFHVKNSLILTPLSAAKPVDQCAHQFFICLGCCRRARDTASTDLIVFFLNVAVHLSVYNNYMRDLFSHAKESVKPFINRCHRAIKNDCHFLFSIRLCHHS